VIVQIAGAALVYTSSLHALIAADALGVPHVLELSTTIGGLHKFRDYASAFGESIEPEKPRLTDRGAMAERQRELRALLAEVVLEATADEQRLGPRRSHRKGVTSPKRLRHPLSRTVRRSTAIREG
jgi:hypothetical protein